MQLLLETPDETFRKLRAENDSLRKRAIEDMNKRRPIGVDDVVLIHKMLIEDRKAEAIAYAERVLDGASPGVHGWRSW